MNARRVTMTLSSLAVLGVAAVVALAGPGFAAGDVGSPLVTPAPSPSASPSTSASSAVSSAVSKALLDSYGGDPQKEAELVAQEQRRIIDVDLVASGAMVPGLDVKFPFRVAGKPVSTLVLPARKSAYAVQDLVALAPLSFVETSPGEYLLSENIVVLKGATLDLRNPGGLVIKMASQDNGFSSIVIDGGSLVVTGTATEQVTFQSWDSQRAEPDTKTSDGRAYIRVIAGYASITNATFSDLGFWSGLTGGLSLTGTELAPTLGLSGDGTISIPEAYLAAPPTAQTVKPTAPPVVGGANPIVATDKHGKSYVVGGARTHVRPVTPGKPVVVGGTSPTGKGVGLTNGTGLYSTGVTAWLSGLTVTGNAYGLFVSNAKSVELQNSTFKNNLVDGVDFHREVTDSRITGVESSSNGSDGFHISRGSQGVLMDSVVAANNKGNGITIDAAPLSNGPSAVGFPVLAYGGHSVLNSKVTNNAHYGIAVLGGDGIVLRRNTITGGEFGIIVGKASQGVDVEANRVSGAVKQGIAVKDGAEGTILGNLVIGGEIGIHVRDSKVFVTGNTIQQVSIHGVSMVGDTTGSMVDKNVIAGHGNSPIDTVRSNGVNVLSTNESPKWVYQNITERIIRVVTKPMTMLWTILALILIFTAFRGFRHRGSGFGSPYGNQIPLMALSRGMIDAATVPGVVRSIETEFREVHATFGSLDLPRRRATDRDSVTA